MGAQGSEQAFAQARAKLSLTAIPLLNDWLIERAEHDGFVPHWKGLRLVAADASAVRFGLRASHVKPAALADQILFGLFQPGCELMLAASLHRVQTSERQMLFKHLDRLSDSAPHRAQWSGARVADQPVRCGAFPSLFAQ